jgi:hypothetical protein
MDRVWSVLARKPTVWGYSIRFVEASQSQKEMSLRAKCKKASPEQAEKKSYRSEEANRLRF